MSELRTYSLHHNTITVRTASKQANDSPASKLSPNRAVHADEIGVW